MPNMGTANVGWGPCISRNAIQKLHPTATSPTPFAIPPSPHPVRHPVSNLLPHHMPPAVPGLPSC